MNIDLYRKQFPVTEKYIYFDHAGVAPMSRPATAAVQAFLEESARGAAFHYPDWIARVLAVRTQCARLINAGTEEVAFVRSTSHGLSLVAQGLDWREGDNLIVYEREFPSNLYPWFSLRNRGVEVRIVPSREGRVGIDDIERLMDARTRLVSLSSVQFTNGFRADLRRVGELCRERKTLFCVDAIQSLGVLPMDVKACHVDFLSADAHKWLLGPEGIGIFYCRKELCQRVAPPLIGWKSVRKELEFEEPEFRLKDNALRFEEGSLNLMGIFGLGAAVGLLLEIGIEEVERRVLGLGDSIIEAAEQRGFTLLTPKARGERGGIVTIAGGFDPARMRDSLRAQGVMVNVRSGGIRLSPHFYATDEEIIRCFTYIDAFGRV